ECAQCLVIAVVSVPQFRGNEDLFARHAGRRDCLADTFFVVVGRRGIDAAIASFQGDGHNALGVPGWHLECAEAELGNANVVVQGSGGYIAHTGGNAEAVRIGATADASSCCRPFAAAPTRTSPMLR